MKEKLKAFLLSSADPTKVATTVKGITGLLISTVTVIFTLKGMPQQAENVSQGLNIIADQIIVIIGLCSQVFFSAVAVWGVVRKIILSFTKPTV